MLTMSLSGRIVSVINLGRIGYQEAWGVQQAFVRRHAQNSIGQDKTGLQNLDKSRQVIKTGDKLGHDLNDILLLCEHNPVYTIGIRTRDYPLAEEERLKAFGAEFYRTDRGGLITFHGPGQLVAYPILNLMHFKRSVRWYVYQLERCVIQLCMAYGIKAETSPHTGVWVRHNKIAAIGIHAKRYITSHGLALNCNTDLNWFNHIVPCGIVGKGVTSLTRELDQEVPVEQAMHVFVKCFSDQFACDVKWTNNFNVHSVVEDSKVYKV